MKPLIIVADTEQAVLGVVDEDAGGDVHGVDKAQALLNAALMDEGGDSRGDIDKAVPAGDFKLKTVR